MKKTIIFLMILSIFCVTSCQYNNKKTTVSESILSTISSLPETREMGTDNETTAYSVLTKVLEDYNYNIETQTINYTLADNGIAIEASNLFPINLKKLKEGKTNNIIAKHKQYNASNKDIIISAHYDTSPYPGANDNASGVSVLLELAKNINNTNQYNIIYVLFSGEENFLLGSEYYVSKLTDEEKTNIAAVINLDTLSGNAEPEISFAGQAYTQAYYLFQDTFEKHLAVNLNPPYSSGDEIPFNKAGIPSLSIGQEGENLHTTKDTIENLDMADLIKVYSVISEAIKEL